MSEITFPSEVISPAVLDNENPHVITLVGLGVGIFLTTDNLTTVTNIVDGSVGVATDITDNELGELSNGYRMGADISGLTVEAQADISTNPYQLFQTQEDKQEDYGLKLTTASEQLIIDFTGAYSGTITLSDDSTQAISGSGTFTLDGTSEIFIREIDATDTVDSYYWEFNQTHGTQVKDHINGKLATLIGFPEQSGYVRAFGVSDGLPFNGVGIVNLPNVTLSASDVITIRLTALSDLGNGQYIIDGLDDGSRPYLYARNDNALLDWNGSVLAVSLDGVPIGKSTTTLTEGEHVLEITINSTPTLTRIGARFTDNSILDNCIIESLSVVGSSNLYYDFTRITNNQTVPETLNNQDGTLVNFTDVYIPEKNKTLVGQELSTVADQILFSLTGAWTSTLTLVDGTTSTPSGVGDYTLDGTVITQVSSLEIVDTVSTYNYDFTVESGDTIADTSGNDNHGTVVGGSLRRIYDYSGYGELVGYRFNGLERAALPARLTLLNTDDYTITIIATLNESLGTHSFYGKDSNEVLLYQESNNKVEWNIGVNPVLALYPTNPVLGARRIITLNKSGDTFTLGMDGETSVVVVDAVTADLKIDALCNQHNGSPQWPLVGVMEQFTIDCTTNPSLNRNYDFTTGDISMMVDGSLKPVIEETINGNHAEIVNGSTSKWQPIVPVNKYTDTDYATLSTFISATKDLNNHQKYIVKSNQTVGEQDVTSGFADGISIEGLPADNLFSDNLPVISCTAARLFDWHITTPINVSNIGVDVNVNTTSTLFWRMLGKITLDNVRLKGKLTSVLADNHCVIKNSVVDSRGSSVHGVYPTAGKLELYNNLIITDDTHGYGALRIDGTTECVMYNNLVHNTLVGNDIALRGSATLVGSGNITDDPTASILGIGTQEAIDDTWFIDPANGDYRIDETNTAAMDALQGQGWNGSDIAGWNYVNTVTVDIVGTLSSTFDDVTIISEGIIGVGITGSASTTLSNNTLDSGGLVGSLISGILNVDLSPVMPNYIGTIGDIISGNLNSNLGNINLTGSGLIGQNIIGTLSLFNPDNTLNSSGIIGQAIVGVLNKLNEDNTLLGTGSFTAGIQGGLTTILENTTMESSGLMGNVVSGSLNTINPDVNLTGSGSLGEIIGTLSVLSENNVMVSYGLGVEVVVLDEDVTLQSNFTLEDIDLELKFTLYDINLRG